MDKRKYNTQQATLRALDQLCASHVAFSSVTVSQIAEIAGYSRQTFYRNYKATIQPLEQALQVALTRFETDTPTAFVTARAFIEQVLGYWTADLRLLRLLRWAGLQSDLEQGFKTWLQTCIIADDEKQRTVLIDYYASVCIGAIYQLTDALQDGDQSTGDLKSAQVTNFLEITAGGHWLQTADNQ